MRYLALCAFLSVGAFAACRLGDAGDDAVSGGEQALASNINVLTQHNDAARTGHNPKEKQLSTSNVNGATFGKLFTKSVDGAVFAQPLYVGGVNGKNVVFVATEHNSVYAFDADAAGAAPLWQVNLGASLPSQDTGCGLLAPEIGITATPVIDLQAKTIWLTTRNKTNGVVSHQLHALDIATGQEKANSPTIITAQAPGTGSSSVNGVVQFDPLRTMQRPGLLKVGNRIYIGFASQCDIAPYHGWVLAYDATTMQQTAVHITTPNGGEGGIWQGGTGLGSDESGDVYYTSADAYDTSNQAHWNGANNLADSMVRLHDNGGSFGVMTSFTPSDARTFSPQDRSIGSTGGILLPGTNLFVSGDKRGQIYVVDRTNMGGTAAGDAQIVQKFQGAINGIWGGPAYMKRGTGGMYYVWGNGDRLKAYAFDGARFTMPPMTNTTSQIGYPGGQISISSDADAAGSAVLWTVRSKRASAGLASSAGAGVLEAFDALDITQRLWTSETNPADGVGNIAKFAPPMIANGRVFVGTASNELVVYGLKNVATPPVDAGVAPDASPAADAGTPDAAASPTFTAVYTQLLGPGTPGHCSNNGSCHTNARAGFKCGTSKAECYQGLVDAMLVDPANGAASVFGQAGNSPLAWLGGSMPLDNGAANAGAAAMVQAWVAGGAKND